MALTAWYNVRQDDRLKYRKIASDDGVLLLRIGYFHLSTHGSSSVIRVRFPPVAFLCPNLLVATGVSSSSLGSNLPGAIHYGVPEKTI